MSVFTRVSWKAFFYRYILNRIYALWTDEVALLESFKVMTFSGLSRLFNVPKMIFILWHKRLPIWTYKEQA